MKKMVPSPEYSLWRIKSELRAYLARVSDEITQDGIKAAPYALLDLAKFLNWHGPMFDALPIPRGQRDCGSIADLGAEIAAAVLPLCGHTVSPLGAVDERLARLELDFANLQAVLRNRGASASERAK